MPTLKAVIIAKGATTAKEATTAKGATVPHVPERHNSVQQAVFVLQRAESMSAFVIVLVEISVVILAPSIVKVVMRTVRGVMRPLRAWT